MSKIQCSIYNLHSTDKMYKIKISTKKTKVMGWKGKFPVKTKVIIDNNTFE